MAASVAALTYWVLHLITRMILGGAQENTLNYDVRTLGRTGVLSLNMVDTMSSLPAVREVRRCGFMVGIELVEDLGSDANVYGHSEVDGGQERFVVRTERRYMPHMGETIYIRPQTSAVHVFNAGSGVRI